MHKIYGNRSNYSGPAVFGDFIDYAGLYQPVHVVCPIGTYIEGTVSGKSFVSNRRTDRKPS